MGQDPLVMCLSVLAACLCTKCVPTAYEAPKRATDPLEQELWEVVNTMEIEPRFSEKDN